MSNEHMSEFQDGLSADVSGDFSSAVEHYEAEIEVNTNPCVDVFINLAFVYWYLATESPFAVSSLVPFGELSILGGNRYPVILDLGLQRFKGHPELRFWKKYFQHILYGEPFSVQECEEIINSTDEVGSVVPYFFLWMFDKEKYATERAELLRQCEKEKTTKNRYITSILSTRA